MFPKARSIIGLRLPVMWLATRKKNLIPRDVELFLGTNHLYCEL